MHGTVESRAADKRAPPFAQDSTELIYLAFIGTGTETKNKKQNRIPEMRREFEQKQKQ